MFRLIAATLVSAYALLAISGPGPDPASWSMRGTGVTGVAAPRLHVGHTYRVRAAVDLRSTADPSAAEAALLATGTAVVVVSTAPEGYAKVRDTHGRTGYVPSTALSASL